MKISITKCMLAAVLIFVALQGCAGSEPKWVPIPEPEKAPAGVVLKEVCPHCQECYPDQSSIVSMTLVFGDCANDITYTFTCRTTGEGFQLQVNECDQIEWGMIK